MAYYKPLPPAPVPQGPSLTELLLIAAGVWWLLSKGKF